jgi:hypothetical protein
VRVFFRRQIVFGDEFGCDGGFGHGKFWLKIKFI